MVVASAIGSGAAGSERVKAQYARLSSRNGGVERQKGRNDPSTTSDVLGRPASKAKLHPYDAPPTSLLDPRVLSQRLVPPRSDGGALRRRGGRDGVRLS